MEQKRAAIELDGTDLRLLDILQEKGRLSNQEIAERVGADQGIDDVAPERGVYGLRIGLNTPISI